MPSEVFDEHIHQFSNFNGCTIEVGEWIGNCITLYNECYYLYYLPMLGSQLIYASERVSRWTNDVLDGSWQKYVACIYLY